MAGDFSSKSPADCSATFEMMLSLQPAICLLQAFSSPRPSRFQQKRDRHRIPFISGVQTLGFQSDPFLSPHACATHAQLTICTMASSSQPPDLKSAWIHEWQSKLEPSDVSLAFNDVDIIRRTFDACIAASKSVTAHLLTVDDATSKPSVEFKRSLAVFVLWAHDHNLHSSGLNMALGRSSVLRGSVLEAMVEIATIFESKSRLLFLPPRPTLAGCITNGMDRPSPLRRVAVSAKFRGYGCR